MASSFLERPGSAGAVGALMDEYARAADELCRVVERFHARTYAAERPSDDPDTRSPKTIAEHVAFAAQGYANYLLRMQGLPAPLPESPERNAQRKDLATPASLRGLLAEGIRRTESVVEPLRSKSSDEVHAMTLRVGWGPVLDPESILEHAIVHLLRHRRQLERWTAT